MQNIEKNYEGAEGEGEKKLTFNSQKEFGKGSFIYDVRRKV